MTPGRCFSSESLFDYEKFFVLQNAVKDSQSKVHW